MAAAFDFKPAVRENVPLLIGLDGASGSGKTYTALLLATGIADAIGRAQGRAGRVFGIDTERGRMLHYADDFTFMYGAIEPPFGPGRYGEAIASAERAGADVIVVDSFSHEWEGEGGVREMADVEEANGKKSPSNWIKPKTEHKRLVNKMLASRAHVIVCMRSEEKMRVEAVPQFNADGSPKMWNGKPSTRTVITPAADIPLKDRWVPICEKRFPYEITTSFLLTPEQPGIGIPRKLQEQHKSFFPEGRRIGRESGEALANWAMGGAAVAGTPSTPPADRPSTHPTATLAARADKVDAAMRGSVDLAGLTKTWRLAQGVRDELKTHDPDRLAELERTYTMLDAELDTPPADAGYPGDA
jgi:hypothetical protein